MKYDFISKKTKYASKIRSIIYVIVERRNNIIFTTLIVNCFSKNLGPEYFSAVNQILKYLAKSENKSITFEKKSKLLLISYFNINWQKDQANRKSMLMFIFIL